MAAIRITGLVILMFIIVLLSVSPLISLMLDKPVPVSAIRSYSMEPALTRGDLVIVLPTNDSYSYSMGQVVVFRSAEHGINEWTMHRIVGGCNKRGFTTKGDANFQPDQVNLYPTIQPNWIAGIAITFRNHVLRVPLLGFVILFFDDTLKNPFLLSAFLMLLALLILWKPKSY